MAEISVLGQHRQTEFSGGGAAANDRHWTADFDTFTQRFSDCSLFSLRYPPRPMRWWSGRLASGR